MTTWKQATKPTRVGGGNIQIGRAPIGFEQIRRAADLRGWYFGHLIASSMNPPIPNGLTVSQLALFVFAVDAYRQRPDTYLAEAIFNTFLPVSLANPRAANVLGLPIAAVVEISRLRAELDALLWKNPPDQRSLTERLRPMANIRQGRAPFRADAFDPYQNQALQGAMAALPGFNQIVWPIIDCGSSGFTYNSSMLVGDTGWGAVRKLNAAGFNCVALLGTEGQTAPGV